MKAYFGEEDNRYIIRYRDWNNPDHKEFRESFDKNTTKKKDVKLRVHGINHKIQFEGFDPWEHRNKNKKQKRLSYPLQEAIEDFVNYNMGVGNWSSDKTEEGYRDHIRQIINGFGKNVTFADLSEQKLQGWISKLNVSVRTKKSYCRKINTFLKWVHQQGHTKQKWEIHITPAEKKALRNTKKIKYITYHQLSNIVKGYHWRVGVDKQIGYVKTDFDAEKYSDIWWFMFWQMLRKSELPLIKKKDVDLSNNKVRIHGKGKKIDWIYVVPPAQKILKRRMQKISGESVFSIGPKSVRHYDKFVDACNMALGKKHSSGLHQLRHGGAVHYFTLGKSIQFISKMLRHETIEVTLRVYEDVLDEKLEDVFSDVQDKPAI